MSDLKIWKTIFEVRFPATASLLDKRGAIATKWQWQDDLSEWEISNNQVTIHNKANSKFLRVGLRNAVTIFELPDNIRVFQERTEDFILGILDLLEPRKIERVGLKIISLAKRSHFKLLVANMRKELFTLGDSDWKVVGGPPEDLAFPLVLQFDAFKANFNVGPMIKEQLASYFESGEVKQKLPAVALFVDFDLYRVEPSVVAADFRSFFHDMIYSRSEKAIAIGDTFVDKYGGFE